jgi:hypothetical protein
MTDTSPFQNNYEQYFTVGGAGSPLLSFDYNFIDNGVETNTPDGFVFNLLDSSGTSSALPTADPFNTTLLTVNYQTTDPQMPVQLTDYSTNLVTVSPLAAPEPSGWAAMGLGVLMLTGCGWAAKRRVR